jgi:hypothetical protein
MPDTPELKHPRYFSGRQEEPPIFHEEPWYWVADATIPDTGNRTVIAWFRREFDAQFFAESLNEEA